MSLSPYLAFAGNAREAFTRYQEIFGGELTVMSFADAPSGAEPTGDVKPDAVMHASLVIGGQRLLGADDPSGGFDGSVRGMCVCFTLDDPAEATRVFKGLSAGGDVQMAIGETFFSPAFGMCTDRFGTPWMIMTEQAQP
jgi:PhnB protein